MQFVDIKNDIAFRKVFGNELKTAPLISFLNAALQLEGKWTKEEIIAYDNVNIKEADEIQEKIKIVEDAQEKKAQELIIQMDKEGLPRNQIARITGKKEEEVDEILRKSKSL
jgi:hypothetical protein